MGESTSLGVPFCIYSLIPLSGLLPDSSLCIISTVKGVICWLSQFLAPAAGCHGTPTMTDLPSGTLSQNTLFFQKSFWLHVLSQRHKVTQTDVLKRDVPIRKHSKVKEEPTEAIAFLRASLSTAISLLTCIPPSLAQCKQRGKLHTFPLLSLRRVEMGGAPLPRSASWRTKAFSSRPSRITLILHWPCEGNDTLHSHSLSRICVFNFYIFRLVTWSWSFEICRGMEYLLNISSTVCFWGDVFCGLLVR